MAQVSLIQNKNAKYVFKGLIPCYISSQLHVSSKGVDNIYFYKILELLLTKDLYLKFRLIE